ncbi:hypothetical protein GGR54DRAFT_623066 [Hypoxylon sp. NC1633]|nr:hypothetical protein GGR54DRAFT_623066 [Hypoxylon sp. NC1633]
MRFLCLHGIGTSASIFETQLSTLCYRLGEHHEYEFIEGSLACPPAKGIEEVFGKQDTCYAYFDASVASILKAVHDLAEFLDNYLTCGSGTWTPYSATSATEVCYSVILRPAVGLCRASSR